MGIEEQFMGMPPARTTPVLTTPPTPLSAEAMAANTELFMRETGMIPGEPKQPALKTKGPARPVSPAVVQRIMIANGMV